MTLHLLFLQEDEEFRSVPQVKPEISVGLFLYEYQKRYSGWFANPLRKRSLNRHHLNVVVKTTADYTGTWKKDRRQALDGEQYNHAARW